MFEQTIDTDSYNADKKAYYRSLCEQLKGLLSIESDAVTNMAQTASFIFHSIPDLNWSGFYRNSDNKQLLLGPYHGKVACVHIEFGRGVCGHVAETKQMICVNNVHEFEGHIACDSASNSEIVIPVIVNGKLKAVLDIDSPLLNRFDQDDLAGFQALCEAFVASTTF